MSQSRLQKLGGLALVIGGLLFTIGNLLHPTEHSAKAHEAATWTAAHVIFMAGMIGILLGLPVLFARHADRFGMTGLAGYTAFFIGVAWTLGGSWFEAFGIPELDETSIHAVENGIGVPYNLVGALLFIGGQVVFGYALYRTRAYSRFAPLAMIVAGAALLPASGFTGPVAGMFLITCTAVLGLALAYMGRCLVKETITNPDQAAEIAVSPSRSVA